MELVRFKGVGQIDFVGEDVLNVKSLPVVANDGGRFFLEKRLYHVRFFPFGDVEILMIKGIATFAIVYNGGALDGNTAVLFFNQDIFSVQSVRLEGFSSFPPERKAYQSLNTFNSVQPHC
jgi:hypothetical protein